MLRTSCGASPRSCLMLGALAVPRVPHTPGSPVPHPAPPTAGPSPSNAQRRAGDRRCRAPPTSLRTRCPRSSRSAPETHLAPGFVVRADGWVATNFHVVRGATEIAVVFSDHKEFPVVEIMNAH